MMLLLLLYSCCSDSYEKQSFCDDVHSDVYSDDDECAGFFDDFEVLSVTV